MPGHIKFKHDKESDVIIADPKWHIVTEEDCKVWYDEWVSYLKIFGRKMDCIMVLDDFSVEPDVARMWGEYRARINKDHIRHGYRVNPDYTVSIYVKTSGIRYNAATAEAASVEDAMQAIFAARKADGS